MKAYLLFILLVLSSVSAFAQSYFHRTYVPFLERIEQEVYNNDDIILAGSYDSGDKSIILSRFNKCGDTLWVKEVTVPEVDLILTDLKVGLNQNAVLLVNFMENGDRNTLIISIGPNGNLNFSKRFNTGTADIAYSLDMNQQNEILVYFKTNIGQAGPNSENTLAKLNVNGQVQWIKQYGNTYVWGQVCATSDGGALITETRYMIKVKNNGQVDWTKEFQPGLYSQDHFSVPNGYVFFKYSISSLNNSFALMLNKDGSIKWLSKTIPNFRPRKGILRKNGNLLFVGDLALSSTSNHHTLIEIDSSNGNLIKTFIHEVQNPLTTIYDLVELSDSSVIYSGNNSLSFAGETILARITDSLSRPICKDSLTTFNTQVAIGNIGATSMWNVQNSSIPLINQAVDFDNFSISYNATSCLSAKPSSLFLGNDTTLCPGQTITIGSNPSQFEGYKWSTGANTAQIIISKAGSYNLKAWNGCDTLRDRILIQYHQLPKLELGNDTSLCNNTSLSLSTNQGEIAAWSTGDTATSITINQAGMVWAEILTVCGKLRDSISISYIPSLKASNFPTDTTICPSKKLYLSIDPNASYILWSNGETSPNIEVNSAGTYSVVYATKCDTIRDNLELKIHQAVLPKASVSTQSAQVLDSVFFTLSNQKQFQSIYWDFKDGGSSISANTLHQYKDMGSYQPQLDVTDFNGCKQDTSFILQIKEATYFIPNVFTPNNDGINDAFEVLGKGINQLEMTIYNRWGKVVYHTENSAWDGRAKGGKVAKEGSYFYQIKFKQIGNKRQIVNGTINLIRGRNAKINEN